jgi:hypothetical protein
MQQKAALKTVEELLRYLQKSVASSGAVRPARIHSGAMVMFSRQGRSVTLLNDEAIEYGTVVNNLYGSLTDDRRLTVSRKVIEGLLQEAIVTALFTPPNDAGERLDAAIKLLTHGLSQPTADWEVYLAVSGLAAGKRRRRFGRVVFQPVTAAALNALGTRGVARALNASQVKVRADWLVRCDRARRRPYHNIDLLIDEAPENVARVREALRILEDKAVDDVADDDVARYSVVRVADEIVVDQMARACGRGLRRRQPRHRDDPVRRRSDSGGESPHAHPHQEHRSAVRCGRPPVPAGAHRRDRTRVAALRTPHVDVR